MLSITICTWNRAEKLRQVLAGLADEWARGGEPIEVLVIDNNCTDSTAEVVASFADRLPVRRVFESHQGLSIARNRAVHEAAGDLVIFLDDDIRIRAGWLDAYRRAFADPAVMVAGGRVTAIWPERLPRWMRGHADPPFYTIVPHYDLGDKPIEVTDRDHIPPTANVAVRASVFRELGGFREDLGMVGGKLAGGEDTELMERILRRYGSIRYLPDAHVDHPVDQARLSLWRNLRYLHGGGIGQARFETTTPGTRAVLGVPLWAVKSISVSAARVAARLVVGDLRSAAIAAGRVAGLTGFVRGKYAGRRG